MTTLRFLRAGSDPRGAPRPRLGRRPLALVVLAVAGLAQSGCRSSGMCGNPCGPSLSSPCNWFSGLSQRMFRPRGAAVAPGCCGPEAVGEAPITELQAAPAVVPVPGPAIIQQKTAPAAGDLEPAAPPNDSSKASNGTQGASRTRSPAGRVSYDEVSRPRDRTGRDLARTSDSLPEPTSRSAQGSSAAPAPDGLDNLPPLEVEIPGDLTAGEAAARPAGDSPAATDSKPPATTEPAPGTAAAGSTPPTGSASSKPPSPAPATNSTSQKSPAAASATPGPRRFVSLEPKLAGGSLPDAAALDWLRDKGYKTVLDLRESAQVQPSFIADVTNRGMRYVALPVSVKTLDADHISRFQFELSLSDARPLYFCDSDGFRAGALWYIRRMTVDKIDQEAATREAEDLGLTSNAKAFWQAVTAYVERVSPPKAAEATPPDTSAEKVFEQAAKGDIPAPEPAPRTSAANTPAPAPDDPPAAEAAAPPVRDTTAWRSFAALFFTGLVAPLAYMGFAALPTLRHPKRASLPAPARRPKSLPGASGE